MYCARAHIGHKCIAFIYQTKEKHDKNVSFLFSNIIIIVFDVLFYENINWHIIDLFNLFF